MKYIKTYEYRGFYNPGDIVIIEPLTLSDLGILRSDKLLPTIGAITEIEKKGEFESSFVYHIDLGDIIIKIGRNKIKMFANPEEIKQYNLKKNLNKFNI